MVSHYLHKDSKVYGCFLDASKAFDRVDHRLLFQILSDRDLPKPILKFIFSWYSSQSLTVKWKSTFSSPFGVSNGVRQGGVLSPILFTVYLDVLISRLVKLDIGCHLAGHFVGSLCYADDIALLAPSPSALRMLLHQCEVFAAEFGIIFNANKTQLICFRPASAKLSLEHCTFFFMGERLKFSESVTHLGYVLQSHLSDSEDIKRAMVEMCRKANFILQTIPSCDPVVLTKLFHSHCLFLYGSNLWKLDCKQIRALEVCYKNILRKIWKLPRACHIRILHKVAGLESLYNMITRLQSSFLSKACTADSLLIKHTFTNCSTLIYTVVGYNNLCSERLLP